jgi:hypothetical protein
MTPQSFTPALDKVLHQLTVPALPDGFADRLIARIDSGDMPLDGGEALAALPLPRLPAMQASAWRRTRRVLVSAAAFGLATATAAASGIFGEPVYVPMVSDALAKADLVELPKKTKPVVKAAPKPAVVEAKPNPNPNPNPTPPLPVADPKTVARDLILSKWQDPNFRKLPKEQRQAAMQAEVRAAMEAGRFTREDFRAALTDVQNERRARNAGKAVQDFPKMAEVQRKQKERVAAARERYDQASPEVQSAMRDNFQQAALLQKRMRELRRQLREADPADQPAIRREMREVRETLMQIKTANDALSGEGNVSAAR